MNIPDTLICQLMDALRANQIFHTPIALRRRGGTWDEYEIDAIKRTREALALLATLHHTKSFNDNGGQPTQAGTENATV